MKKLITILALLACSTPAIAGVYEISGGFNYNRTNYNDTDYSWSRRWGLSVGYYFTERSEIEVGYQDVYDRTFISNYEDTTFHDQVYSANWVQYLTSKNVALQPYFKVGIGQLNREATGSYTLFGTRPASQVDSITGIAGLGLKLYFTRELALRGEVTSYLTGGRLSTYADNIGVTFGLSFYF